MVDLPRLLTWILAHDRYRGLVISCGEPPTLRRGELGVVWDGDIDTGTLAQLLACGIPRVEFAANAEVPDERIEAWQRLFDGRVAPRRRRRLPSLLGGGVVLDGHEIPLARRAVLGLSLHPPFDLAADHDARSVAALALLGVTPEQLADAELTDAENRGNLLVASDCTACGVCVLSCPEGALLLTHEHGASTLRHDQAACRGCGECIALCPVSALSSPGLLTLADALAGQQVLLATVATRVCSRCGQRHDGDGELCELCAFRRRNPFAALSPEQIRPRSNESGRGRRPGFLDSQPVGFKEGEGYEPPSQRGRGRDDDGHRHEA
ncbi:DUF362 domain-containing protein [Corynebacterium uterequi]|uniref:4Fe-4S dicluster domain n=1 Tax=Corynebacterium uterequi TaxID=1072256 RepID=A0A0G3HE55_9CORY|nr:4Fe-4S dicluster domain-containing protein [Corynebacterium uterequi]AKK10218.1 4Fe-4S dicluster domain [Corynebacterium uterequi]